MSAPRIVLFARWPEAGQAKTRLIPAIGAKAAAALHARLVERTLATMRHSGLSFEVHFTGAPAEQFAQWLGDDVTLVAQAAGDLGRRMAAVAPPCVLIGADIPDLGADHLNGAADAVARGRTVIGPAADGGYYLIGLPASAPDLFTDMAWGTARVLAETLDRLARRGVAPVMLPVLHDLDRPEDLARWQALVPLAVP